MIKSGTVTATDSSVRIDSDEDNSVIIDAQSIAIGDGAFAENGGIAIGHGARAGSQKEESVNDVKAVCLGVASNFLYSVITALPR